MVEEIGPETAKRTPEEIEAIREAYFDKTRSLRSIYTAHTWVIMRFAGCDWSKVGRPEGRAR